jgi:MFS family permease
MLPAMSEAKPAGSRAGQPDSRAALPAFVAVVFLLWLGQYVFLPTLPQYLQDRTGSLSAVGLVLSMYGLWQALTRLPLGVLIDRVGRRRLFLIAGLLISGAGTLLLGYGRSLFALLAGRSLTGLAMAAWVPMVVVFSGFFPPSAAVRATSILTLITALTRIVATAVAGPLDSWGGYTLPFVVGAAAAAAGALLLLVPLPLPAAERTREPLALRSLVALSTRRDVLVPSLLAAVNEYMIFGVSMGFLPLLARELGADALAVSRMATLHLVVFTGGNLLAANAGNRLPRPEALVLATYPLFALGIAACALTRSVPVLFVVQAVLGLAHGIDYPTLMGLSIREVSGHSRTTAMGVHQSIYGVGIFVGPWACGLLADALGLRPMFAITAAVGLALGWGGTTLLRPHRGIRHLEGEGEPPIS